MSLNYLNMSLVENMALNSRVYRHFALPTFFLLLFFGFSTGEIKYEPNWKSLDTRPLPAWFDEGKVGIFLHWGVFSVPSFGSEWFWYYWKEKKSPSYVEFMKKNYPPGFTYADFAPKFTTEFFDPDAWAALFEEAGAKYVVLTSKHHEGYTNWPSKVSWNWNSMDVGPHRDLVGELAQAVKKTSVHFGLYHSLFEWFNPLYLADKANNFQTQKFVTNKAMPELYELVNAYKPDIIWSDGDWETTDIYWNATNFLAWLYNESPVKDTVCVNDRWGKNIRCKHGGFLNCEDKYNPANRLSSLPQVYARSGVLQKKKWENAMSIDLYSWGYRRNLQLWELLTTEDLIEELAKTVSCGGNLLVNVGPTHDGRIAPIFEQRLLEFGAWLKLNGEAIYGSKPWTFQNDTVTSDIWYTSQKSVNGTIVYAIVLKWPKENTLRLGSLTYTSSLHVSIIGYSGLIHVMASSQGGILLTTPVIPINEIPMKWALVLKITGVKN